MCGSGLDFCVVRWWHGSLDISDPGAWVVSPPGPAVSPGGLCTWKGVRTWWWEWRCFVLQERPEKGRGGQPGAGRCACASGEHFIRDPCQVVASKKPTGWSSEKLPTHFLEMSKFSWGSFNEWDEKCPFCVTFKVLICLRATTSSKGKEKPKTCEGTNVPKPFFLVKKNQGVLQASSL